MTNKQLSELKIVVKDLQSSYPDVKFSVSVNYYTKLADINALTDRGGYTFSMHKDWKNVTTMTANFNSTTRYHEKTGFTVSSGFGTDLATLKLERVNFAKFLAFTKEQAEAIFSPVAA